MSEVLGGGSPLDRVNPAAEITAFDRKVYESLQKVLHLPDDFKNYMVQYQTLNPMPVALATAFGTFAPYTPTWTATGDAPSLGNGVLSGEYMKIGGLVIVRIEFQAGGSTTFGTGTWGFSVPIEMVNQFTPLSFGTAVDSSSGWAYAISGVWSSVTTIAPTALDQGSIAGWVVHNGLTFANPFTFASGDVINLTIVHGTT